MGVGTGPSLTFWQPRPHHRCPPKLHVCQWFQEEHRPLRAGPVPPTSPLHRGKLGGLGGMSSPSLMEDSKPVHATEGPHLQGSGRGTWCPSCWGGGDFSASRQGHVGHKWSSMYAGTSGTSDLRWEARLRTLRPEQGDS